MENTNDIPVVKKIWELVSVMYFMLRKGISKRKLLLDLNMMMKRGKIAGRAIHNLMFHHHHNHHSSATVFNRRSHDGNRHLSALSSSTREYEFSCSNSPTTATFPFHLGKSRKHHGNTHSHFFSCAHAPQTDDDVLTVNAVKKALEMMSTEAVAATPDFWHSPMAFDLIYSELSSPALPGFGRTPMARQLRITDSPFPLRDADVADSHVDEAAEEFIVKFYNELRKQNKMAFR